MATRPTQAVSLVSRILLRRNTTRVWIVTKDGCFTEPFYYHERDARERCEYLNDNKDMDNAGNFPTYEVFGYDFVGFRRSEAEEGLRTIAVWFFLGSVAAPFAVLFWVFLDLALNLFR